ncbi:MAG: tyrosine-type recombinase/integrase [Actinobacteria bacterium]|nr:tyrosine-type recombinase/integrase [Actinomycetota bacterium]
MAEGLGDLCASFQRHLRAEGKAPRTQTLYGLSVRLFSEWLTKHGRCATLDELTRPAIRDWLADLAEDHATSTVRTRFQGLRRFCGWLVAEGELPEHPMAGLAEPEIPAAPVPVLEDAELAALIATCKGRDFTSRRDEALIRVLLDTGVRVSEACGLVVADVDLDREMALVTGKGRKVRPIYFGTRTVRALDRYLRERRRHRWTHLDALFLTQRGALSTDGARDRIKVRAREAGLKDRMHPHRFRHTFAHDFLISGGQERELKRLAGWSSDVMLERYGASAADRRAREATRQLRRGDRV